MPVNSSPSEPHSPSMHLLSNGRLSTLVSDTGSGFCQWRDAAVTRWRADPTRRNRGSYILLRDVEDDTLFAPTRQPLNGSGIDCSHQFESGTAVFECRSGDLDVTLTIAIARDSDAELRQVRIQNNGDTARTIEITSYAELVLGPAAADASHPAFSKLFVQTEFIPELAALLATRRPREHDEKRLWAMHFTSGDVCDADQFESDRARFLGRGRQLGNAQAFDPGVALSNTAGCVLDPIFSLRRRISVEPGQQASVAFWTLVGNSREALLDQHKTLRADGADRKLISAARKHAEKCSQQADMDGDARELQSTLLAALLVADPAWRSPADTIAAGRGGAPTLWAAGISGDRPIILVDVRSAADSERVESLLRMQANWQSQWVGIDVVLLNHASEKAGDALQEQLEASAKAQNARLEDDDAAKAQVFALRTDAIDEALHAGLRTVARVVLDADAETWRPRQRSDAGMSNPASPRPQAICANDTSIKIATETPALSFENGYGGFSATSREYVITLSDERLTPLPWINVVANPDFGFLVSAEGGGYTWSGNSQQNPLTPWPNDPVSDAPSEVLYLHDEDSGELWSATALPIRFASASYRIRHGKGYSVFTHEAHGIAVEVLMCVPVDDPIKLSRLRIVNRSGRVRRLSVTAYVEWALGAIGSDGGPTTATWMDEATGALLARNAWRDEFGERVAFLDLGGLQHSLTGDRDHFLGDLGSIDRPAALAKGAALSGRTGAGIDPCGALQTRIELDVDAGIDIVCSLGEADSAAAASTLIEKYRGVDIDVVMQAIASQWNELLDCVTVHTPDASLDLLLNDWLPYQALSCRVWARTAYYQASGAYGFRDQLQDVMALCVGRADLAREHILRAAGRQFVEGDVQHWWLPPRGQGIRTRMSDDRVWLPYVAAHYIAVTGDHAILDETLPFLTGQKLEDGQNDAFFVPDVSDQTGSLYEHCARAIDVSLTKGPHDLPLIGTGDWNDGMNRVGVGGRGESVWLAWFLLASIDAFLPHARAQDDESRTAKWTQYHKDLRAALDAHGWDGDWFRRGYYDDGTPLGSAASEECRIDTIAQSWSVLAAAEAPSADSRPAKAMAAVEEHLIWRKARVAPLLTPPFDRGAHDPGYIQGYPPGIRENGGQYTHGSIWGIFAFARLGDGDRAGELFSILNPIRHADSPEAIARYRVEPYVSCADVYSVDPHVGRGGWTWYSGSGAWLYRAGLEALLGFHLRGDTLKIDPCIPKDWPRFAISYRHRGSGGTLTRHDITVENPDRVSRGVASAQLDGKPLRNDANAIPLSEDGGAHTIVLILG